VPVQLGAIGTRPQKGKREGMQELDGANTAHCGFIRVRLPFTLQQASTDGRYWRLIMLNWALVFLVVALVAAVMGFSGIAVAAAGIAKILFVVFLVLFLVSIVSHLARGHRV